MFKIFYENKALTISNTFLFSIIATRSAYLFFSIVGFVGAIVLFVIHVLNVVHFGHLAQIPWILVVSCK